MTARSCSGKTPKGTTSLCLLSLRMLMVNLLLNEAVFQSEKMIQNPPVSSAPTFIALDYPFPSKTSDLVLTGGLLTFRSSRSKAGRVELEEHLN